MGQLTRERYPNDCVLVGFTTYTGTVTAASEWGAAAERKRVRRAVPESFENVFHEAGQEAFLLLFPEGSAVRGGLSENLLERAIGVIYRPRTEMVSHYFRAKLSRQFDAVIHLDETRAVEPLEPSGEWGRGEPAETFPSGV